MPEVLLGLYAAGFLLDFAVEQEVVVPFGPMLYRIWHAAKSKVFTEYPQDFIMHLNNIDRFLFKTVIL